MQRKEAPEGHVECNTFAALELQCEPPAAGTSKVTYHDVAVDMCEKVVFDPAGSRDPALEHEVSCAGSAKSAVEANQVQGCAAYLACKKQPTPSPTK